MTDPIILREGQVWHPISEAIFWPREWPRRITLIKGDYVYFIGRNGGLDRQGCFHAWIRRTGAQLTETNDG